MGVGVCACVGASGVRLLVCLFVVCLFFSFSILVSIDLGVCAVRVGAFGVCSAVFICLSSYVSLCLSSVAEMFVSSLISHLRLHISHSHSLSGAVQRLTVITNQICHEADFVRLAGLESLSAFIVNSRAQLEHLLNANAASVRILQAVVV